MSDESGWRRLGAVSQTLFLTVEGDGFAFDVEVDPKRERQAREFAAKINAVS